MILPDVNILVHAFRRDSNDHELCHNWLEGVVNGDSLRLGSQILAQTQEMLPHYPSLTALSICKADYVEYRVLGPALTATSPNSPSSVPLRA